MNNKPFLKQYIAFIGLIITFGAFFGTPVNAAKTKYPAGTVIQALDTGTIYYIATDGRRYGIPNMAVYHSWYTDFSSLKSVPKERDLSYISATKNAVTVRPGSTLIKFGTDQKIYAVDSGATIRWITSATIAEELYGSNWQSWVLPLPANDRSMYTLGQNILDSSTFSRPAAIASATSIEDVLRARRIIRVKNSTGYTKVADASFGEPLLKSLRTDLRHSLSPYFRPGTSDYKLVGDAADSQVTITPTAYTNQVEIKVNDTTVPSGTPIVVDLDTGLNPIVIIVRTPLGLTQTYSILVDRIPLNTNPFLKSLNHNLRGKLSPAFTPGTEKYDLRAEYLESSIVLRPSLQDNRGKTYVNDVLVRNGVSHTIALSPGGNEIIVRTIAENGREKVYTLNVFRTPWVQPEDLELASLQENLSTDLLRKFDPHMTLYDMVAYNSDDTITITARPRSRNASVYINGELGQKRIVPLSWGETEIKITVAIGVGATRDYILTVDRRD